MTSANASLVLPTIGTPLFGNPAAKARILLVDDEPKNLIALEAILEGDDRELVRAGSGTEALRHLLQNDFALIILDVHMPTMDGFETAELIRARERSRDIPILFITAAVRGEFSVSKGYALGAVDYLVRPIEPEILRFKVDVFVDLYRKTSEVREQANQIAEAEAFLRSVLQGATEHAIVGLSPDGVVEVWNEGARRIYGFGPETIIGRNVTSLFPVEGGTDRPYSVLRQVDRDGQVSAEVAQLRADGRTFDAEVTVSHRRNLADEPAGYVFIARDLTMTHQAEEAREELSQLRVVNALKDEFLGLVSHELRTPLTTILGNAQALTTRLDTLPRDVVSESLQEVVHNGRRLQTMVESMLLLSHLESGQELELEPVLVQRLLPGIIHEFAQIHPEAMVELHLPSPLPPALAHPAYVTEIVLNLLSNAAKYSPAGTLIEVAASVEDGVIAVAVLDRGAGVTSNEAATIFQPFQRLERTQFLAGGAGLGLTVCRRLIEALGGNITCGPREGGGSEFSFTLPQAIESEDEE